MTVHDQIRARIAAFASELEALVRVAAIDAVTQSLGGSAPAPVRAAAPAGAAAASQPEARRARGRSGGKRDPKVLAGTVEKAAEWIKGNPGKGVEAMAAGLKLPTKDLALPIIKLLDANRIKKTGQKRATKYFPR